MSSDCVGFVLGHGLRELLITAFVLGRSEESVNFLQFCPQKRSLQGSCYFYYLGAAHRPSKVVRGAKRRLGLYATSPPPFLLAGMQRCCTHRLPSGRHPRPALCWDLFGSAETCALVNNGQGTLQLEGWAPGPFPQSKPAPCGFFLSSDQASGAFSLGNCHHLFCAVPEDKHVGPFYFKILLLNKNSSVRKSQKSQTWFLSGSPLGQSFYSSNWAFCSFWLLSPSPMKGIICSQGSLTPSS